MQKHYGRISITVFLAGFWLLSGAGAGYGQYPGYEDLFGLQNDLQKEVGIQRVAQASGSGGQILQLEESTGVTGLAVSGTITLDDDNGYARIILVDNEGGEYLVYETNKWLTLSDTIQLDKICEETAQLNGITLNYLRIESDRASVVIDTITVSTGARAAAKSPVAPDQLLQSQVQVKIDRMNSTINARGAKWIAGETSVSQMSYAEKKQMMGGNLPNLSGFEYYIGGIFEIESPDLDLAAAMPEVSSLVSDFTWRDRHGQDWITSVKNQSSCGSCWAFAATGTTEAFANLYYNQQLDLDLSEQYALSCSGAGSCSGGSPGSTLNFYKNTGAIEEGCFPYAASDKSCDEKCSDPDHRIFIGERTYFNPNAGEDALKQLLFKGPVSFGIYSWSHAIGLVGYKTLAAGDRIYVKTGTGDDDDGKWVNLESDSPYIGRTAWEIKNSWGKWWGQQGFAYVLVTQNNMGWVYGVSGPMTSTVLSDAEIRCVDNDGDGYYFWGAGARPSSCPANIPDLPDGDDSDAGYGPMDEYGHLVDNLVGDVNLDEAINLLDLLLVLKIIVGLDPDTFVARFDVNGNNVLDVSEAVYLLRQIGG